MAERVTSAYCEVCGAQRKFVKEAAEGKGGKSHGRMVDRAYKDSNPLCRRRLNTGPPAPVEN